MYIYMKSRIYVYADVYLAIFNIDGCFLLASFIFESILGDNESRLVLGRLTYFILRRIIFFKYNQLLIA